MAESSESPNSASGWEHIDDIYKPHKGKIFNSLEEGENFYREYAKVAGFSVRKSATMIDKATTERYSQQFVCSKQGLPVENIPFIEGNAKRKRAITRENCMAGIRIQKDPNGKWSIRKFTEAHSHACVAPRKQQFLRSNRKVTEAQKSLIHTLKEANIKTSATYSVLAIESGDYGDIGCTERDIRNALQQERDAKKGYDAQLLLEHLEEEKAMDQTFYYAFELDNEKKLTHVFWADGLAIKAYQHFGDVVVFDTTYDTNQYRLIFAPFTEVNHHGQSVNFGAGFICNEKIESFVWLFEKFYKAMCSRMPTVIITDQDAAMGAAIKEVFPSSIHKYCMWHILKKLPEKLNMTTYKSEFSIPFHECVWNSETPEEFESRWENVISSNDLHNHAWLTEIFSFREKWIPAYSKDVFTAGIRTTQRSESMNSFFDKYVSNMNTLIEFISRFERAIRKLRQNELAVDFDTLHTKPLLRTELEMEAQMSEIYTKEKFSVFQEEAFQSLSYGAQMQRYEDNMRQYYVKR